MPRFYFLEGTFDVENHALKLTLAFTTFPSHEAYQQYASWKLVEHVETNKQIKFLSGKRSKLGNFTATWKLH